MIKRESYLEEYQGLQEPVFDFFYRLAENSLDFDFNFLEHFFGKILIHKLKGDLPPKDLFDNLESKFTFYKDLRFILYLKKFEFPINRSISKKYTFGYSSDSANDYLRKNNLKRLRFLRIILSNPTIINFSRSYNHINEAELRGLLNELLSEDFLNELEKISNMNLVNYLLWRLLSFREIGKGSKIDLTGKTIYLPRPFDRQTLNFKSISYNSNQIWLGHNGAYEKIFKNEHELRPFTFFNYLSEQQKKSLSEDSTNLSSKAIKRYNKILINLFPFGDSGYAEYECNDFYQRDIIFDFLEFINSLHGFEIFISPHPSTLDDKIIDEIFERYPRFIKTRFSKIISSIGHVINTYRSTSTLQESINLGKNTTLILSTKLAVKDKYIKKLNVLSFSDPNWKKELIDVL